MLFRLMSKCPLRAPLGLTNDPRGLLAPSSRSRAVHCTFGSYSCTQSARLTATPSPSPNPANPVFLTLTTLQILSGGCSAKDRPEVDITTIRPFATLARYVSAEDTTLPAILPNMIDTYFKSCRARGPRAHSRARSPLKSGCMDTRGLWIRVRIIVVSSSKSEDNDLVRPHSYRG